MTRRAILSTCSSVRSVPSLVDADAAAVEGAEETSGAGDDSAHAGSSDDGIGTLADSPPNELAAGEENGDGTSSPIDGDCLLAGQAGASSAGFSSHIDDGFDAAAGAELSAARLRSSKFICGNARVSPCGGGASQEGIAGGGGGAGDGCEAMFFKSS